MADLDKFLPIVHYYARANYPRHLQTACEGVLKRSPGDPVPQFWLAFGKLQEGRHAEVSLLIELKLFMQYLLVLWDSQACVFKTKGGDCTEFLSTKG